MRVIFVVLSICTVSHCQSQFVARFPYYSPQEFLYDSMSSPPLSFSMDSIPSSKFSPIDSSAFPFYSSKGSLSSISDPNMVMRRDLPSYDDSSKESAGGHNFDQPGLVPKFTGGVAPSSPPSGLPSLPFNPSDKPIGRIPKFKGAFMQSSDASSPSLSSQPGMAPRFTGSFMKDVESPPHPVASVSKTAVPDSSSLSLPHHSSASSSSVSNPSATFLMGTNFENVAPPKCRMLNCAGPVPNDGSSSTASSNIRSKKRSACSQVLVPINGCAGGAGYPMAMVCSVCCECSRPLVSELLRSSVLFQSPSRL